MRQALADSSGARKEKTLATFLLLGFKLVAWDGIEPSTRGFSTQDAKVFLCIYGHFSGIYSDVQLTVQLKNQAVKVFVRYAGVKFRLQRHQILKPSRPSCTLDTTTL